MLLLSTDEMIEMFQGKVSNGLQSAIKLLLRDELKFNLCQAKQIVSKLIIIYIKSRFKCSCMLHNLSRWIIRNRFEFQM